MSENKISEQTKQFYLCIFGCGLIALIIMWIIWVISLPIGAILNIWNIPFPYWNTFWVVYPFFIFLGITNLI